ncbi:uncharacterized protein V1516DRAFT_674437 [Lipomyces oligophaga]|uniref:uncharacterized protein n=1 Tax=Lipomyces oligophaga TaxID=45792 RepID=UPI0034CDCC38
MTSLSLYGSRGKWLSKRPHQRSTSEYSEDRNEDSDDANYSSIATLDLQNAFSSSSSTSASASTGPSSGSQIAVLTPGISKQKNALYASTIRDRETTARLNKVLTHISEVFPDTDVGLLRKLMADNRGPSQLAAIVELLLSSPMLARNRRRVRPGIIADWEQFRSQEYRSATARLLAGHFKPVLHISTVENVLAQNNSSFVQSLPVLEQIATERANRRSILRFFMRGRPYVPLDISAMVAARTSTGCAELDNEIAELDRPRQRELLILDESIARESNEEEYAKTGQLMECECCFGEYAWEDLACCSEVHFFCRNCLTSVVKEGLFGHGYLRGKATVSCISAVASPQCKASIPVPVLRTALPAEIYAELEKSQVTEFLSQNAASMGFVVCPFCAYSEQSPAAISSGKLSDLRFSISFFSMVRFLAAGGIFLFSVPPLFLTLLLYCVISTLAAQVILPERVYRYLFGDLDTWFSDETYTIMRGVFKKRHGSVFKCKNPECGRVSCTECMKEFFAFHKCFEKEEDRMRVYIEKAMAEAVKRTCPQCHTSFIKSEGCNKLTCQCGYVMCYVCRKDIKQEGYQHFCDHFRAIPGSACTECDKCDLYKVEDESISIQRAAKEAEAEFIRTNGLPSGLDMGGKVIGPSGHEIIVQKGIVHVVENVLIDLLDTLVAR